MKTLKAFTLSSNIQPSLIRAVVTNMGGWEYFKEQANDVVNHGASGGFGNFCYYSDTVKFARKNNKAILKLCEEFADSIGEQDGILSFIASFNCLNNEYTQDEVARAIYQGKGDSVTEVMNALAWFALEEVCRSYVDLTEE